MVVPLPCGKLQSWRGLGVKAQAARGTAPLGAKLRAAAGAALVSVAAGLAAIAQEPARVQSDLLVSSTLERIAAAPAGDGTATVSIAPDTASHAEQLIVSVRFTNASDKLVDSIRITSPVPAGVQYVPRSTGGPGADALFSVDDGRSFGRPEELTLAAADGGVRAADPAEYTHVRWVLRAPLDAGATGIVRFRAVPR